MKTELTKSSLSTPSSTTDEQNDCAVTEIDSLLKRFLNTSNVRRRELFIDRLLAMCEPQDLVYLNKRLDEHKRDFFALLPLEIIERVLTFLDWQSILNCCQVCYSPISFKYLQYPKFTFIKIFSNDHIYAFFVVDY